MKESQLAENVSLKKTHANICIYIYISDPPSHFTFITALFIHMKAKGHFCAISVFVVRQRETGHFRRNSKQMGNN